ncbi:hypothetical protein GCM10009039_22750 [Halocalculus aciditolerans]|uniref:Uncharacterized protein n=2 Tax=Halocalculus aciditolerans TaxID=1383812 RepID=A0A830FKB3_9EURY|nr:hypothetical protein GCM10009039_22750 [Halocalculus aciditolerans]
MVQSLNAAPSDYTDENRWRSYFDNSIRTVAETAIALHEFRQELIRKCDGIPFNELQEQWDYSQVLLGGVDENGEYRERSLAKLYKEVLGLQFSDMTDMIEKQRQGISPSTKVVVEDTPFTNFVAESARTAEAILQQAEENDLVYSQDVDAEYDFYDLLSDQGKFTQMLSDFLYRLQDPLPNYNERALFVWTLPKTTNRYLSVAYPKLKDRKQWEWLDETFGLEPIFVPAIDESGEHVEERQEQYTVYDYRGQSLGERLVDFYELVWEAFDGDVRESLRLVFPDVPNFKEEFLEEAHTKLSNIGWDTPERLTFQLSSEEDSLTLVGSDDKYSSNRGDTTKAEYRVSGITLDQYEYRGYNTSGNRSSMSRECSLSLLRVLDELSPGLFLLNGLEYELHIDQGSLEVEKL